MDVSLQVKKLMYIMLSIIRLKNNMQLRFIRLLFLFLKIEIDMFKVNLDLEEVTAQVILERW